MDQNNNVLSLKPMFLKPKNMVSKGKTLLFWSSCSDAVPQELLCPLAPGLVPVFFLADETNPSEMIPVVQSTLQWIADSPNGVTQSKSEFFCWAGGLPDAQNLAVRFLEDGCQAAAAVLHAIHFAREERKITQLQREAVAKQLEQSIALFVWTRAVSFASQEGNKGKRRGKDDEMALDVLFQVLRDDKRSDDPILDVDRIFRDARVGPSVIEEGFYFHERGPGRWKHAFWPRGLLDADEKNKYAFRNDRSAESWATTHLWEPLVGANCIGTAKDPKRCRWMSLGWTRHLAVDKLTHLNAKAKRELLALAQNTVGSQNLVLHCNACGDEDLLTRINGLLHQ